MIKGKDYHILNWFKKNTKLMQNTYTNYIKLTKSTEEKCLEY